MKIIPNFGLNTHVPDRRDLEAAKSVGCEWIRVDIDWRNIENKQNSYNFKQLDNAINLAKNFGFKIYATIAYSPKWHRPRYQDLPDKFEWLLFLNKVVMRYSNKLDVISIWNEPNLKGFGNFSVSDYISILLKPSYEAIKKINPNIKVAAGDISTLSNSHWYEWVKEIRKNTDFYDIFAIHSYKDSPNDLKVAFTSGKFFGILGLFIDKYKPYNKELSKIKDKGKEIWLTETGWKTNKVSYSKQETYYKKLLEIKDDLKVDVIIPYELRDYAQFPEKWGIFDDNLNPKRTAKYFSNLTKHT